MDGIEAARQIGGFSPAKILFTTGHSDPEMKARALALKPAGYLIKPVEIHHIIAAIQKKLIASRVPAQESRRHLPSKKYLLFMRFPALSIKRGDLPHEKKRHPSY